MTKEQWDAHVGMMVSLAATITLTGLRSTGAELSTQEATDLVASIAEGFKPDLPENLQPEWMKKLGGGDE